MFFQVPPPRARAASAEPVSHQADDTPPGSKRPRTIDLEVDDAHHPRNPRACDRCRVKKSRCLPDGRSCKRCKLEGAICTKSHTSTAAPKFRTTPAYVQMLEGQRDTLVRAIRQLRESGEARSLDPALKLAVDRIEEIHRLENDESGPWTSTPSESPTSLVENVKSSTSQSFGQPRDQSFTSMQQTNKAQTTPSRNETDYSVAVGGVSTDMASIALDASLTGFAMDDWVNDFALHPLPPISPHTSSGPQ